MKSMLKDIYDAVVSFSGGLSGRKITTYSAACAYYLFMSLVPLTMLLVSIIQYTPLTEDTIMLVLSEYVPDSVYQIFENIVSGIYNGGKTALTISIFLTIWSASSSMKALMRGMDSVYDVPRKEDFITFSLRACIYMVILVATLLISFFVIVYGGKIVELVQYYSISSHALEIIFSILSVLRYLLVPCLLALVFSMLYKMMPAKTGKYKHQWPGAIFCAISWVVFSSIFSFYVSLSDKFGAYGFIGTIMVAMIWIFYCFYFLLLGGYINHYIDLRRDREENIQI